MVNAPPISLLHASRDVISARVRRTPRAPALSSGFAFGLLLGVVVVLFMRPADIVPAIQGWPIYQALLLGCAALALPVLFEQILRPRDEAITACVLGLIVAVIASHLSHGFIWGARHSGPDFAKLAVFYLLVVGIVRSEPRLRRLLQVISACVLIMTVLAVWQYYGVIDLPALQSFQQTETGVIDPATGLPAILLRLCGAGIFNDPNDFCLVLIFGMMLSLWRGASSRSLARKIAGFAAAGFYLWALQLTHSRGGFMALLAAVLTLAVSRGGLRRVLFIGAPITAALFLAFAGRQTQINASEGTGLSRLQLWSEAIRLFKSAPIFGIGMDQFREQVGLEVHNSFLHGFVELGMVGGTLFLGAFAIAATSMLKLRRADAIDPTAAPDIIRLRPYLFATLIAYVVGYMSLSRSYTNPTYLLLAIIVCYTRLIAPARTNSPRMTIRLLVRLSMLSVLFLFGVYAFVRVFVRWS